MDIKCFSIHLPLASVVILYNEEFSAVNKLLVRLPKFFSRAVIYSSCFGCLLLQLFDGVLKSPLVRHIDLGGHLRNDITTALPAVLIHHLATGKVEAETLQDGTESCVENRQDEKLVGCVFLALNDTE